MRLVFDRFMRRRGTMRFRRMLQTDVIGRCVQCWPPTRRVLRCGRLRHPVMHRTHVHWHRLSDEEAEPEAEQCGEEPLRE